MTESVIHILDALFECTLDMINKDLEEFPEHRINFFKMLQSINRYCFPGKLHLYVRVKLMMQYTRAYDNGRSPDSFWPN